ncbi:MAG: Sensor histidine kinase CpxA [Fimbriimonadaceae bacterium]|nr:Sensor histidine kinase CpxA [Fimbriimonadaceae bacterium]
MPFGILVSALAGAYLARRATEPIKAMADAAQAIDDAHLDQRLPVVGDDEMAHLGKTFNGMVARLERSFADLTRSLEDQKRFVADASHELKTPLARARLATTAALSQSVSEAELLEALRTADAGIGSVTQLVHQLLDLARSERPADQFRVAADIGDVIREVRRAYGDACEIEIAISAAPATVRASRDDLSRAVSNLIDNAMRYGDPPVEISTVQRNGQIGIRVRDHGPGVDPIDLPNLGKRFFRPDQARSRSSGGAGLGLAIVKATAEKWGGNFEIGLASGGGLEATIFLPIAASSSSNPNSGPIS